MTTNYLKKIGVKDIVVKAQTDEHGEVLSMVGATRVVFPDREAAIRIAPMLASSLLFNFMPISESLALAEVRVNEACRGKTLLEANLRKDYGLNVVALRKMDADDFAFVNDPSYTFNDEDVLLVAGTEASIYAFSQGAAQSRKNSLAGRVRGLFARRG